MGFLIKMQKRRKLLHPLGILTTFFTIIPYYRQEFDPSNYAKQESAHLPGLQLYDAR